MFEILCYQRYEDIKQIDEVLLLIQSQMHDIKSEKSVDDIHLALRNALMPSKRARLFVGYKEGKPIGFIFGNICSGIESGGDYFWMNEIHVQEEKRRQEVASMMIKYLEKWLRDLGIKYIYAITSKQNAIAKNLYHKLDFNESEVVWIDKHL